MLRLFASVSLLLFALSQSPVHASPCLTFDVNFNLLALGYGDKDWNAGTQDVWATGQSSLFNPPSTSNFTSRLTLTSLCSL